MQETMKNCSFDPPVGIIAALARYQMCLIGCILLTWLLIAGINPQSVSAVERPDLNGILLRKPNDKDIFWIDQGKRRKIINLKVLLRLFKTDDIKAYENIDRIPEGSPITGICSLWRCEDGTVIFVDNQVKRVIVNLAAFHRYHFNLSGVRNASCLFLTNIPEGEPLY